MWRIRYRSTRSDARFFVGKDEDVHSYPGPELFDLLVLWILVVGRNVHIAYVHQHVPDACHPLPLAADGTQGIEGMLVDCQNIHFLLGYFFVILRVCRTVL